MPKQRRVSGVVFSAIEATPKLSQFKAAHGGGDDPATCPGSVTQHDLGRTEKVLEFLRSGSQPECDDAVEHITTMDQDVFMLTFLGQMRPNTLHNMAQCLGALPGDGHSQQKLLTKIRALKLSKKDLAESGLQRTLRHLESSPKAATAKLANRILGGKEAKSDSARYALRRVLPGASLALLAGNLFCIAI